MNRCYRLVSLVMVTLGLVTASGAHSPVAAQSEIDLFMEQVLERRQENWIALHQYILEEEESVSFIGPDGSPLWSFDHEYSTLR